MIDTTQTRRLAALWAAAMLAAPQISDAKGPPMDAALHWAEASYATLHPGELLRARFWIDADAACDRWAAFLGSDEGDQLCSEMFVFGPTIHRTFVLTPDGEAQDWDVPHLVIDTHWVADSKSGPSATRFEGEVRIPVHLPAGRYRLLVNADGSLMDPALAGSPLVLEGVEITAGARADQEPPAIRAVQVQDGPVNRADPRVGLRLWLDDDAHEVVRARGVMRYRAAEPKVLSEVEATVPLRCTRCESDGGRVGSYCESDRPAVLEGNDWEAGLPAGTWDLMRVEAWDVAQRWSELELTEKWSVPPYAVGVVENPLWGLVVANGAVAGDTWRPARDASLAAVDRELGCSVSAAPRVRPPREQQPVRAPAAAETARPSAEPTPASEAPVTGGPGPGAGCTAGNGPAPTPAWALLLLLLLLCKREGGLRARLRAHP